MTGHSLKQLGGGSYIAQSGGLSCFSALAEASAISLPINGKGQCDRSPGSNPDAI